jgi:hypothetical protein
MSRNLDRSSMMKAMLQEDKRVPSLRSLLLLPPFPTSFLRFARPDRLAWDIR